MKTIGILGGMGPAATVDLMNKIINMTKASSDNEHIPMLVDSNTRIPDRTEAVFGRGESPVPEMTKSAERLEKAGADFIIIPCNTAHFFLPEIESKIDIPIINMPLETARMLKSKGIKKAAVLATEGTCKSGLYDKALEDEGIQAIYPTPEQQNLVTSLVYDFIKKGIKDAKALPREEVALLIEDLKQGGAEVILLACTELPIAFESMELLDETCVDPTAVLAAAAIRHAGAEIC